MLVEKFYIKDIKKYEEETGNSIINILSSLDFEGLIDLMVIGNLGKMDKEQCYEFLDMYLRDHDIVDAFEEIKDTLFGDKDIEDGEETVDISQYKNLTEVYSKMCFEIMSVGISFSEFWCFTTLEMYDAFNTCNIKVENDINNSLAIAYNQAALIGSAVWGHLPKEIPHISLVKKPEQMIHTEEFGDLTPEEYRDMCKMRAQVAVSGGE